MVTANELTDKNWRNATLAMLDEYDRQHKQQRRKPRPIDVVVVVLARAMAVQDAVEFDPRPREATPTLNRLAAPFGAGGQQFYAHDIATADAVLAVLPTVGNRGGKYVELDATTWRMVEWLASQRLATGTTNESAVGRKFGLSHTTVGTRTSAICFRIMAEFMPKLSKNRCKGSPKSWTANSFAISQT